MLKQLVQQIPTFNKKLQNGNDKQVIKHLQMQTVKNIPWQRFGKKLLTLALNQMTVLSLMKFTVIQY